ncbi:hypothetical protein LINPERPRIM_LOCUS30889 [Linum perenne]
MGYFCESMINLGYLAASPQNQRTRPSDFKLWSRFMSLEVAS